MDRTLFRVENDPSAAAVPIGSISKGPIAAENVGNRFS
jgi:hypothetical protein